MSRSKHCDADGLRDRVAIITGATRGIGAAIASAFHGAGAHVLICGRSRETPEGPGDDWKGIERVRYFGGSLADSDARTAMLGAARNHFGGIDILVNNAAVQHFGRISGSSDTDTQETFEVNVTALAALMRDFVDIRNEAAPGAIVNIASTRASRPGSGLASYSASKAAVVSLTQSAAAEYGAKGIRVNAVSPGLIERPGLRESWSEGVSGFEEMAPLGRIGQPEDIAEACLFLAGRRASWITGHNLVVDGGITLVR